MSWTTILVLAAGTYLLKAVGPLIAGGRELPEPVSRVTNLLPAALLAALVAVQTVGADQAVVVDARLAGVAVAGVAVLLRAPFLVVMIAGSATAALLRAVGGG